MQVARKADNLLLTFRGCIVTVIPRLFIPTKTSSAVIYNLFVECGIMFPRRGTGGAATYNVYHWRIIDNMLKLQNILWKVSQSFVGLVTSNCEIIEFYFGA